MRQYSRPPLSRRQFLLAGAALATLPVLQGCFPVAAGGAFAGAAMFADRRTSGAYVEDEAIEWKTRNALRQRFEDSVNISVTSYNRNVLLTGQVPNETSRSEAGRIAASIDNVNGIVNELVVGSPSSLTTRANDAVITSMIKARFVDDPNFAANHVKVVTESNVVFLMGIVTREEANAATEVARTTQGVQKVIRAFEYISRDEAIRLDRRTQSDSQT